MVEKGSWVGLKQDDEEVMRKRRMEERVNARGKEGEQSERGRRWG